MSAAARRIHELRANEWRVLVDRGRSAGRGIQEYSLAQIRRHPALAIGAGALLGVAAFAHFRRGSSDQRDSGRGTKVSENGKHEPAPERKGGNLVTEMLSKAAHAWVVHTLTQSPASKEG